MNKLGSLKKRLHQRKQRLSDDKKIEADTLIFLYQYHQRKNIAQKKCFHILSNAKIISTHIKHWTSRFPYKGDPSMVPSGRVLKSHLISGSFYIFNFLQRYDNMPESLIEIQVYYIRSQFWYL